MALKGVVVVMVVGDSSFLLQEKERERERTRDRERERGRAVTKLHKLNWVGVNTSLCDASLSTVSQSVS